jgi:RNA:NAD 2'-phosphotransferase (TPT1/KptA family)
MKSKTADSWAELDREIDEVIAKLNAEQPELDLDKLLAVAKRKARRFSLEG